MKLHSCGAILYTIFYNKVYIILGKEYGEWFPFKGTKERNETFEQTAIREIEEETCHLVKVQDIALTCNFTTARKIYHIGLVFVPYTFIREFYAKRRYMFEKKYLEKTHVRMFSMEEIQKIKFHPITEIPVRHYCSYLTELQNKIQALNYPEPKLIKGA